MEKFSEKLVSKVVYIKILLATNPEILDKFLRERGWDLLNFWFAEGIRSSNWPLCNQIVQLFLLSPTTAERLRENSDQNRAPKLVRQLTYDSRVDDTLRDLSNQAFSEFLEALKENYTRLYDILHQADEDSASQAPAAAPIRPPTPCTNCLMPPVCKNGQPVNDVPKIGMRFMTGNEDDDDNILDVKSVTKAKAKTRGGKCIYDVRVRWNADGTAVQWTYPNDMLANKCRYFCDVD